ncbi:hypothetical protein LTR74_010864 [Friedmanniomyces endolithicus]|nr:hypothetical protein LTR74_010864 [Friedmanniomyces endolithicus]
MTPGETAAVCCPSPPNPQENNCVSIGFAPTNFFVVSCEDNGDSTGSTGSPAYITLPQTQTSTLTTTAATGTAFVTTSVATSWLFSANAVQLRWQSKDLSLNISSSAAVSTTPSPQLITTSSAQGITTSNQQTSNPSSPPPSGLSTGAEAGIGVGIGLLAVAVLIGFLVWCLRRRKSRAESPVSPSRAPLYSDLRGNNEPNELAGRPVYELDEQRNPHEADSKAVHVAGHERQELDGGSNR